jgi:hypothetical protein
MKEVTVSGTFVLKSEKNRYRYTLEDEKGEVLFTGPFIGKKEKALAYIDAMQTADSLTDNFSEIVGPDGSHVFRGDLHTAKEGEKGSISDATPLGFSAKFKTAADMEKALKATVKAAKGAALKDET